MKLVRNILTALVLSSAAVVTAPLQANQYSNSSIRWQTNYQEALNQAKQTSQPIVLFFTGSDWCGWCNKIEGEALDTPEFAQAADGKFIFVKLDFPMHKKLDPQTEQQNNALRDKYNIKGYPSVIVINSNERVLGTTGYVAGGGRNYAEHLKSFVR